MGKKERKARRVLANLVADTKRFLLGLKSAEPVAGETILFKHFDQGAELSQFVPALTEAQAYLVKMEGD